jgi:hypothetical protein
MDKNYLNVLSIDTSGALKSGTWAPFGTGFSNFAMSLNEVIETNAWLNGGGWANSDVVGGQIKFEQSGKRVVGDAAQDYIFSDAVRFGFGQARKTQVKFEQKNGLTNEIISTVTVDATIVKAAYEGGDTQAGSAISVAIDCNGAPALTVGYTAAQTLTVVSLAGTGAGKTSVYVNPVKAGTSSHKFKVTSVLPAIGATLTTGWTAMTAGEDAITANVTTGDVIVVAEVVTSTNVLLKAGTATVTTG